MELKISKLSNYRSAKVYIITSSYPMNYIILGKSELNNHSITIKNNVTTVLPVLEDIKPIISTSISTRLSAVSTQPINHVRNNLLECIGFDQHFQHSIGTTGTDPYSTVVGIPIMIGNDYYNYIGIYAIVNNDYWFYYYGPTLISYYPVNHNGLGPPTM
jgi:hypothetical protein